MLSKGSKAYGEIRGSLTYLMEGTVVSIDPSIGSTSSMPGYAVYRSGNLVDSGIFEIDPHGTIPERLQKLSYYIRKLYQGWQPDTLVYEDIPAQRYGGGSNANAHSSLIKAVGTILSVSGPHTYVGLMPISWKKMTRSDYVKSDIADAEEIGRIAISEAHRISETDPPGRANRRRNRTAKA